MRFPDLRPDRAPVRSLGWVAIDVALAAALAFLTVETMIEDSWAQKYGEVPGWSWAFVLLPTALVPLRRFFPATVLHLATVGYVVAAFGTAEGNSILAAPFLAYTVAVTRPPRASRVLIAAAAVPVGATALYGPGDAVAIGLVVSVGVYAVAWIVGVRARESQSRAALLEMEAAAARAEAEAAARQAVEDERARIARELHDAVGHAVNVIVMQAGAARLVTHDERTSEALRNIERVGRTALADLDTMLGLLKPAEGPDAPLEPAHRLSDLSALVERVRSAGVDVELRDETGDEVPSDLDGRVGAAAYRIVQESLTNIAKHAGPASAEVVLRATSNELVVSVIDDGRGAAAPQSTAGGGRGIIGMRERVHVLGGHLAAGPRPGGGYAVEAHIPLREVSS